MIEAVCGVENWTDTDAMYVAAHRIGIYRIEQG